MKRMTRLFFCVLVAATVGCAGNPFAKRGASGPRPGEVNGQETHGGDQLASIFVAKGYRVYLRLTEMDPTVSPLPAAGIARFLAALNDTRVDPVDHPLMDSQGDVVAARTGPDPLRPGHMVIELDRKRWEEWFSKGVDVYRLVFHEYLWAIGEDDANYRMSNRLDLYDNPPGGLGGWTPLNARDAPLIDLQGMTTGAAAAAATAGRLVVMAPTSTESCAGKFNVASYDFATESWTTSKPTIDLGIGSGFGNVVLGGAVMIFGGACPTATKENLAFRGTAALFYPNTQEWRVVNPAGAPTGRRQPLMLSLGQKAFVWGGADQTGLVGSGSIYDRDVDQWTPVAETDAPAPGNYGGVWLGPDAAPGLAGKIVVWKKDAESCEPTASVYDPALAVWSKLESKAPPSFLCRWENVAWTPLGFAFLFEYPQTDRDTGAHAGGLFWNPSTDEWAVIPATGAPSQRKVPSVVWADDKLIVFGGHDIDGYALNTGSVFVPATGTWHQLQSVGAPNARTRNVALWTSIGMVIWGGRSITEQPLRSGAIWRP